ncbi:unnamed protein product, partial [marine sediment metagenome]
MWGEWIDDPKMNHMSLPEQGAWWRLVTLSHRCNADGALVYGNGQPITLDDIVEAIRCTNRKNRKVFDSMMAYMMDKGSLHWEDKILVVTNLKKRQEKVASETPEAVRERVRRHREQKAVTEKPLHPLTIPTTTKEGDIEAEAEVKSNDKKPVTRNGKTVTPEAILAEISNLYEKNFGILTPILAEKFKDFAENYRGPLEWLHDAFEEACSQNVRKWSYVETIPVDFENCPPYL